MNDDIGISQKAQDAGFMFFEQYQEGRYGKRRIYILYLDTGPHPKQTGKSRMLGQYYSIKDINERIENIFEGSDPYIVLDPEDRKRYLMQQDWYTKSLPRQGEELNEC